MLDKQTLSDMEKAKDIRERYLKAEKYFAALTESHLPYLEKSMVAWTEKKNEVDVYFEGCRIKLSETRIKIDKLAEFLEKNKNHITDTDAANKLAEKIKKINNKIIAMQKKLDETDPQDGMRQGKVTDVDRLITLRQKAPQIIEEYRRRTQLVDLQKALLSDPECDGDDKVVLKSWVINNSIWLETNNSIYMEALNVMKLSIQDLEKLKHISNRLDSITEGE